MSAGHRRRLTKDLILHGIRAADCDAHCWGSHEEASERPASWAHRWLANRPGLTSQTRGDSNETVNQANAGTKPETRDRGPLNLSSAAGRWMRCFWFLRTRSFGCVSSAESLECPHRARPNGNRAAKCFCCGWHRSSSMVLFVQDFVCERAKQQMQQHTTGSQVFLLVLCLCFTVCRPTITHTSQSLLEPYIDGIVLIIIISSFQS